MKNMIVVVWVLFVVSACAQEKEVEVLPVDIQIKTALLAAPDDQKEGAMVYGYDKNAEVVVLREGTNNLVCLADNPHNEGIQVSCYFKALDPFMKRGRDLKKEGKTTEELRKIRGAEIESGALKVPDDSMLYIYFGTEENYDKLSGALSDGRFRYVIYTPFATSESTGLPLKPHAKGMPWLMDPGTPRAHIMIGPN